RIPRWFLPISGDLRAGGRYQLEGHAGGKITICDPPHMFHATWEYGEDVSWLEVDLAPAAEGTKLTLKHIMPKDDKAEAHWQKYGPGATGVGWDLAFLALDYVLTNIGVLIDSAENAAWVASAAGKRFVRDSAQKWGEAHISSGEARDIAVEMARRTTDFYTGE
ncbi:MAG: SRPBCC domain-containing protein, partial [Pseudomonadota bacterium]